MINKVILVGRLGMKPELKQTTSGVAVANFTVATNRKTKDKEVVEWNKCTAWDKNAENIVKYLDKGSLVYIEGHLQTQEWDKDGEKRYTTGIQVEKVQFLSTKSEKPTETVEGETW